MDASGSRCPADLRKRAAGNRIFVEEPAWRRLVRAPEQVVARVLRRLGSDADVVLASDRLVRGLNARHRGRNKPTNVLTFEPPAPGLPGEIVLAMGIVRREAAAAGKRPAAHLAHLVAHGVLHLRGHDHHGAGEARSMEMAESRALAGLGFPNPWRTR